MRSENDSASSLSRPFYGFSRVFPMVFLWFSRVFPMVFLWFSRVF